MNRRVRYLILLILLLGIGVFNIADFVLTNALVVNGDHYELNPLMRGLLDTPYFFIYKIVLIPLGLYFLWRVRHVVAKRLMGFVWFTFFLYCSLMIYVRIVFF